MSGAPWIVRLKVRGDQAAVTAPGFARKNGCKYLCDLPRIQCSEIAKPDKF